MRDLWSWADSNRMLTAASPNSAELHSEGFTIPSDDAASGQLNHLDVQLQDITFFDANTAASKKVQTMGMETSGSMSFGNVSGKNLNGTGIQGLGMGNSVGMQHMGIAERWPVWVQWN
ncbi:hypothetical protein V5O48_016674 [Marasmius crinis-equi]|uniref:Pentapeptide repeat-containing protein n=1 Tax=Marasmius crinis-equi TaxID=585013 RepID=A0ABR3ER13_9AGAR